MGNTESENLKECESQRGRPKPVTQNCGGHGWYISEALEGRTSEEMFQAEGAASAK